MKKLYGIRNLLVHGDNDDVDNTSVEQTEDYMRRSIRGYLHMKCIIIYLRKIMNLQNILISWRLSDNDIDTFHKSKVSVIDKILNIVSSHAKLVPSE
jgi:uncharacterized protein YutE (UPF0331/DUF86 family)